jgi:hypothetical protein
VYGYEGAGPAPPSRYRCEIPPDIAKAVRVA